MAAKQDLVIQQGKTFSQVLRWEAPPILYKTITAVTQAAPVRITSAAHGVPNGWRVAVQSVKGMTQLNSDNDPPKATDYHQATVIDANTIEFNDVNSLDYKAYTSGGVLRYNSPVDLAGYTARMKIKDKIGGTVLASTEAGDTPKNIITIALDNTEKTITLSMTALNTAAITWTKGVYDLELVSAGGVVTALLFGSVSVTLEVTTS